MQDDNALMTGHYIVRSFRKAAVPASIEVAELPGRPEDEWYWNLNDGLLPVGPFATEEEAARDAMRELEVLRRVMGGKVLSIVPSNELRGARPISIASPRRRKPG